MCKDERQLAKAINLGLIYGMSHHKLRQLTETDYGIVLTELQAKHYHDAFFRIYKGLKNWHQEKLRILERLISKNAKANYITRSVIGRRRVLCATNANRMGRRYPNLNEVLNSPIQATGADGLKTAIALLSERQSECPEAKFLHFAHDEIVIECPIDTAEAAKKWLTAGMTDGMAPFIDPIPVVFEVTIAKTWGG